MASATEKVILGKSGAAAAAYTATQYHAGYMSAAETVTLNATAGSWITGAMQNAPASGDNCDLALLGLTQILAGGTLAVGDPITCDTSGHFVKSISQADYVYGRSLEAVSGTGIESITALITHEGYNSAFGEFSADGKGNVQSIRGTLDPTGVAADRTIAVHGLGVYLPDNAVVIRSYYFVATTFQSTAGGTDKATLSISIPTDDVDGIVAAVAIETGTPWDAGWHEGIQTGTAANVSEACTAERELSMEVAVAALTAGKLIVYCEYVIID